MCPLGFACPAGSSSGTLLPCARGYFCPAGTANASAQLCYSDASTSAWYRRSVQVIGADSVASTVADLTMVSGTATGTAVLVHSLTGMDGDCNSSPLRAPAAMVTPNNGAGVVISVVLCDMRSRGVPDVVAVVNNSGVTGVVVAGNNGSDVWTPLATASVTPSAATTAAFVVDGDGDGVLLDVVVVDVTGSSTLWLNTATGGFVMSSVSLAWLQAPVAVLVVDIDNDGGVDDVISGGPRGLRVCFTQNLFLDSSPICVAVSSSSISCVVVGDVNNDGLLDVFACATMGPAVLWLNGGAGMFTAASWTPMSTAAMARDAAFGDLNNDGAVDLVISAVGGGWSTTTAYLNNGTGWFTQSMQWNVSSVAALTPALVDVTGDGALDVPSIRFVNPMPISLGRQHVYVRIIGRSGCLNQFGGTVCLTRSDNGAVVGCRVVDSGGGGTGGQSPYDVHFGVPTGLAGGVDVMVRFPSGHVHTRNTTSACAQPTFSPQSDTVLVRDVPAITSVTLSPTVGALVPGGVLNVTLTAAWREVGLVPDWTACCLVNGVNVSNSFVDHGDGSYSLAYVVRAGDMDDFKSLPTLSLALADRVFRDAVSDVATAAAVHTSGANFTIDTHAPVVTFLSVNWNETTRPTDNETVFVSCGIVTPESVLGCSVYYQLVNWESVSVAGALANGVIVKAPSTSSINAVVQFSFHTGDSPVVRFWAIDAVGNVGPVSVLTWTVDSVLPVTVWPPFVDTVFDSPLTSEEFVFSCSRVGCRFSYRFDGAPFVAIGTSSSSAGGNGNASASATAIVNSLVVPLTPKQTASREYDVFVSAYVSSSSQGGADASTSNSTTVVEVRVDGAAAWSAVERVGDFIASSGLLRLTGLSDGDHSIEVRGVDSLLGASRGMANDKWHVATGGWSQSLTCVCDYVSMLLLSVCYFQDRIRRLGFNDGL